MRKSERDALLERAKKLRKRKQQRAGFTDFMAMSESPLVKLAKERLDGRAGAKVTKGRLNLLTPKAAKADTKTTASQKKKTDDKRAAATRTAVKSMPKSDPRGNQIKPTPGAAKKKTGSSYKIKSGDTLSQIAKMYGTSVATLKSLNNIKDVNKIRAGASLKLPSGASKQIPTPKSRPKNVPKKKSNTSTSSGNTVAGVKGTKKKTASAPKKKPSNAPNVGLGKMKTFGGLPVGALRKFNSKTGYNSKKERLKKVGDTTYVFKKGK
jgi:LysM repeat protein